jgi:hypothetical protein
MLEETMLRLASAASALCGAALLLLAPCEGSAKSAGAFARSGGAYFGARAFHRGAYFRGIPARAHRRALWAGGGTVSVAPYGYAYGAYDAPVYVDGGPPDVAATPVAPPRVLNCQRRAETVTVPSEYGGVREIRVTRC